MALDQLLTRIGEFTSYQRRLLALLCLVGFPVVLHEKGPLFWASAGSFHCDTSAMTPPRVSAQGEGFMSSRRPVAVVSEDQCSVRWQVINGTKGGPENNHDDEPCTAWIYEHPRFKSTLVSEWNLVCSRAWLLGYISGLYIIGQIVGGFLFGVIVDRYGRRKPLALLAILQVALSITGAAMPEIYSFLFLRFLLGVVTSGHFIVALIIVTEIMAPRWRMFAVTLYFSSPHFGAIVVCGIVSVMKDRLLMQLVCSMPLLLLLLHVRYVPESPRWLITSGHVTLGRKILLKMADNSDIDLKEDINSQAVQEEDSLRQPFVLCKSGILLSRLMWNSYVWFVLGILIRRLTVDTQHIHRDERVVVGMFSGVDLMMLGIALFLSYRFGRRGTLATLFVVMGVLMQCLAPIPKELAHFGQGLVVTCRLLVMCPFFLYILNFLGCFPTNARGLSLGFGYSTYYIGNFVASTLPHLAAVHPALGYVLLGGLCVLASLIAVFLPDSQSASLPDVTEEAEEIPGRIAVCISPDPLPQLPRCYGRGLAHCDVGNHHNHALRRSTLMPAPLCDTGSPLDEWKSQDGGYVWDDIIRSASL